MTTLQVRNIAVQLGNTGILEDVTFSAKGGALVGLIGPNGAGKSTLGRTICGLLKPSAGEVRIDGEVLAMLPRKEAARRVAFLAQGDAVHWPLSGRSTVELGRAPHVGTFGSLSPDDHAAVDRAMERADALAFADRDVKRLSGGERARVLLARALAVEAPMLIVDEPIGALDPRQSLRIMELLRQEAERGILVIAILHDLAMASRFCDRLLVLRNGRLVADGTPAEVLSPAGMEAHYEVTGHHGAHDAEAFVIPWKAL